MNPKTPTRKFRIEIEDRRTITRETWIVAETEDDARVIAEGQDWRTFSEVGTDISCAITNVEECD